MTTHKCCPRCKSADIARSHRRLYERIIPGLAAYRCGECKHRFLRLRGQHAHVQQG